MITWYNENDRYAAQWLRNLMAAGQIAEGTVDERSIRDVQAADLAGVQRAHFFAGIAGWDLAGLAGWPAEREVWTGSCPCQPFSVAGKRRGAADDRHLWPVWFRLIRERRPECIFGEQVAGAIGHGWLDGVFADLEGEGYACGAVVLGAHSVGAPHIRQRLWWVGYTKHARSPSIWESRGTQEARGMHQSERPSSTTDRLVHHAQDGRGQGRQDKRRGVSGEGASEEGIRSVLGGDAGGVADAEGGNRRLPVFKRGPLQTGVELERGCEVGGLENPECSTGTRFGQRGREGLCEQASEGSARSSDRGSRWGNTDWLWCQDAKYRRTQPGIFPLAHGVSARVGKLRAAGNSIVPQVAAEFVRAFMEAEDV